MGIYGKLLFSHLFSPDIEVLLNCLKILPIFRFNAYSKIQIVIAFVPEIQLIVFVFNQKYFLFFRNLDFILFL